MSLRSRVALGLEALFRPSRLSRGIDREIRFHIDMRTEELVGRGVQPGEARRQAVREFGSAERTREEWHDSRGFPRIDSLIQDIRFGMRMIRRNPGSAAVAALTLALGIGLNVSIFSAVDAVLLRPLPYQTGDRLIRIRQPAPGLQVEDERLSPPEVRDLAAESRTLDAVLEYHSMSFNLLGHGRPRRVRTGVVSAAFFDSLGVAAQLGRTFRSGEDRTGAPPLLVLSHEFWKHALGGDPNIVGQTFEMNDRIHTVVGVLPALPQFPEDNDVYMPVSSCPFRSSPRWEFNRNARGLIVLGRLRPGATVSQSRRELALLAGRWRREHPEAYPSAARSTLTARPLREELTRNARLTLLLLFATTGLVLLIALANVANLILARISRRRRELAIRAAIGAGRGRILRQLVTESTMIALAGGAAGLLMTAVAQHSLASFVARFSPRAMEMGVDARVAAFTLVVSLVTGLAVGSLPALREFRNLAADIREPAEFQRRRSRGRAGGLLLGAQVSISIVLLIGAGLLVRSLIALTRVRAGFDPENVLTARISLDWSRYGKPEESERFYETLLERLSASPSVQSAAVGSEFPLSGGTPWNLDLEIQGREIGSSSVAPQVDLQTASPGYFRTIGVPVLQGRAFSPRDRRDGEPVAIVNRTLARRFWGNAAPVGAHINLGGTPVRWRTVIGVVGDVRQYGLEKPPGNDVYIPLAQAAGTEMRVVVRTVGSPALLEKEIERLVASLDPTAPVTDVHTLKRIRGESLASPRLTAFLLAAFAILALAISAAGIGAITAFSVGQRTREIGIRIALGATRADVLVMVLRESLAPVAAGIAVGLAGAALLTKSIASLLFGVDPMDPLTFALVSVVLSGTATAACLVPGRRAARVDPLVAFRNV
jgi:predicted permease